MGEPSENGVDRSPTPAVGEGSVPRADPLAPLVEHANGAIADMERRIRAFRQGYAEAFRAAVAPFPGLEITVSTHVTTAAVCAEFDEVIEHAAAVLAAEGYTELATRLLEARDAARPVDGP